VAAGYLDRVAAFETLRAYGGRIFHAGDHARRLEESCRALGRPLPFGRAGVEEWAAETVGESGFPEALLRLSVHWDESGGGTLVAIVREFHAHPARLYEEGVRVSTTVMRRWTLKAQDPQIKASQFVGGVLAFVEKKDEGAHEQLFLGPAGTVAEGSVSNFFCVKEKRLLTPSVASGILRGVTRDAVIALARREGFPVSETFLTRHEVYTADECFLTNTSSEILPVVGADHRSIGGGRPGPVTRRLAAAFKKMVKDSFSDE
jgi:branched-chain amino acid aminotransferase